MPRKEFPEKLNICIVSHKFPILGRAATHGFLWPIARGLAARGHNVTVLAAKSPQGKSEISEEGVTAYYLLEGRAANRPFPLAVKGKFEELHAKEPFHLVHSLDSCAYRIGRRKKAFQIAIAYDVEATNMAQIFSILGMAQETLGSLIQTSIAVGYKFLRTFYGGDRRLLKSADGVFVTSPMQRLTLERYYLYPDLKTFTVPYGIEVRPGDTQSDYKTEILKTQLGLTPDNQTIVTVTDMAELQEMRGLLSAFQKVAIKKPHSRLIVVGNGPQRERIEYETYQMALGNRVIFEGAVNNTELADYISLGDIFVNLSARTSGFEPSMLEAMAQEKVIIGSEVSPIATIVENGHDGFLLRPADTTSLSALILDIFHHHVPSREVGARARLKMAQLFDTDKMVDQTLAAYTQILNQTGLYKARKNLESVSA